MNSNRLYKNRSLTDNVNMVFDLVGENWRKWFKMMAYFLLPLSVLLGSMIATFDINLDPYSDTYTFGTRYFVFLIVGIVGCAVVTAMQILLVQWYETHEGTLDGCEVSTMWRMLPRAALECLGVIVLCTPVLVLSLSFIIIPIAGLLLAFAALPIFLVCPIMLLEPKDSLLGHFKRAFSLGYKKWGRLIAIVLIMCLVSLLINNAITFPMAIYVTLDAIFDISKTDNVLLSFLIDVLKYVISVAQCFMSFVEMGLFVLAMTYHYGSVVAETEDIGLENDIDNFAQLK